MERQPPIPFVLEPWDKRAAAGTLAAFGNSSLGERYNQGLFRAKARALASALRSEDLPPPARRRCLDAGVGHGWLLGTWRRQGVGRISGLDLVPSVIDRARRIAPDADLRVADLAAWTPAPGETYDLVCALDVLFYLREDALFERALTALSSAVAPGGLLVVADTFAQQCRDADHIRRRTWASYARVLESQGLVRRRRRAIFALANRPDNFAHWASRATFRGIWNLARARSPLARPLETAAVLALYGLDALILSQGGRWGSQEIAVFRKSA